MRSGPCDLYARRTDPVGPTGSGRGHAVPSTRCGSTSARPSGPVSASSGSWSWSISGPVSHRRRRPDPVRAGPRGGRGAPEGQARAAAVLRRGDHRRLHHGGAGARGPGRDRGRGAGRGRGAEPRAAMLGRRPTRTGRPSESPASATRCCSSAISGLAEQLQIFGVHLHVGVRAQDKSCRSSTRCWTTCRTSSRCPRPARSGWAKTPGWRRTDGSRAADRRPAVRAAGLGRVRALHGAADQDRRHRDGPRGVVGHPPAP